MVWRVSHVADQGWCLVIGTQTVAISWQPSSTESSATRRLISAESPSPTMSTRTRGSTINDYTCSMSVLELGGVNKRWVDGLAAVAAHQQPTKADESRDSASSALV